MSSKVPPNEAKVRYPRIPNVEGISQLTPCQKLGILFNGQFAPDINRKGTEVNTIISITFSRKRTKKDIIIAKKIADNK